MAMMGKIMEFLGLEEENTVQSTEGNDFSKRGKSQNSNIISVHSQKNVKVILHEPGSYEETQTLANHLCSHRSIIVNLQNLDTEQATRVVDFLSGCVYALKGDIKKIGHSTFLCTPDNVEILGDITDTNQIN
ncbi:MAG: cell division protein SepF [Vulcanibacillus sp.]